MPKIVELIVSPLPLDHLREGSPGPTGGQTHRQVICVFTSSKLQLRPCLLSRENP